MSENSNTDIISKEHYFDWAATAPVNREILEESLNVSINHWGNPSSIHKAGTDARKTLEEARKNCAEALNVKPENIIFTSGGTESDHLALLQILTRPQKGSIVLSAIEHPALREMAKMVKNCGWDLITVNPGKDGIISPEAVIEKVRDDTAFVSVMAVNNETGAIQPVKEIARSLIDNAGGKRKPFFHVDCVQAAGKIPLDLNCSGIDSAAFSAHKICGPRGIGILYVSKDFNSFLKGGGQEKNIRSGTENLLGAWAMSLCLKKYLFNADSEKFVTQRKITANFIKELLKIKGASIIPHAREENPESTSYSPWIVQASFQNIPGQVMERALSEKGIYISTGSACSSGSHSRPVLDTMQVSAKEKEGAVRFSFGPDTKEKAIKDLLDALKEITSAFN